MNAIKPTYYKYLENNSTKLKKDAPKWAKEAYEKDNREYDKRMFGRPKTTKKK